jgi:type VI secretion system protein ImpK
VKAAVPAAPYRGRLLWAADTVLTLTSQLRASRVVGDLLSLRQQLTVALREFQVRARAAGSEPERTAQATRILAALLDQVVTSMPWGADSGWQPLNPAAATSTASRPAQQLKVAARDARSDPGMTELIAVVLALGFDARAGRADAARLEEVRSQVTRPQAPAMSAAGLSPQWRAAVARGHALASWLPLWVSGLAAAALLAVLFFGLRISLGATSDRLYARIAALRVPDSNAPQPLAAPAPRLGALLAAQVEAGQVTVRDEIDRSVIVIPDSLLFAAGNAALAPSAIDLLRPIAAALQREPGHVEVVGHTDGTLVPSARYPSEWEFSVERAHAVHEALRGLGVASVRLGYNGRANVEPAASGAFGNGRAEIVLLAGR